MLKDKINSEQTTDKQVAVLRERLNQIGKEREEWFERKETLKKRVAKLISQTKSLRETRDKASKGMEEFTKKRNEVNIKVKDLIKEYNLLYYERKKILKQKNIKQDPEKIKRNIEYYETLLETEAYTFKKEKKLVEYVKGLKKTLEEANVAGDVSKKMEDFSKEIDEHKKKSNEYHKKSNDAYYVHRKARKDFNNFSKKITAFNKLQEKAFDMFVNLKEQCASLTQDLKVSTQVVLKVAKKEKEVKQEVKKKKQDSEAEQIKDKQKQTESKLRRGKKLTTEDIMAFQGKK